MAAEETKRDLFLKRMQVTIAILGGIAALILGVYNINKNIFNKEEPMKPTTIVVQQAPQPSPQTQAPAPGAQIGSALDEVGASWIKKLGKIKSQSGTDPTQP